MNVKWKIAKSLCEILLQSHKKFFLNRIVTCDGKGIYIENPKRKKSWLSPGEAGSSTTRPNHFGKKTLCFVSGGTRTVLCSMNSWRLVETVNNHEQQMINFKSHIERRLEWARRHGKVISLNDNASSHIAKPVKDTLESL
ncbi:mariner Mos1 transposase [Trichonephila clavata]|uniref:Mariner Mos1 transposase n=1 Tax=Trichonephila clavata TaxID=2740835 RepID=A0A8X6K352_TRICU|nr:mariner Mos1 transposase [Trichonephila clavata]